MHRRSFCNIFFTIKAKIIPLFNTIYIKKKKCIDAKIGNFKKYGHTTYLIRLDLVRAEICGQ